ncbi:MAG: hypothetical protein A2Z20_11785 [Bdellovibrionales bacterium RBG_16_40_8]|nr:MAG: hypothetical protein A2Z20_11785 [Bdellovibrionales bacterium RBG_16_40_8]
MNLDLGLLLLRISVGGIMFWQHGLHKLLHFSDLILKFPDPLGVGVNISLGLVVFAEFVCSALVALGLFSRLALIPLITTMAVAAFVIHATDDFSKKELAILFLTIYGALFFTGPGRFSLQAFFKISAGRFSWFLK